MGFYEQNPAEHGDYIQWCENGRQFVVRDRQRLSESALQKLFRHKNYSTFIRQVGVRVTWQLNIYGFRKGRNEDGHDSYEQPLFVRGKEELLRFITRNQKKRKQTEVLVLPRTQGGIIAEIQHIQAQQERLNEQLNQIQQKTEANDFTNQKLLTHYYDA